MSQDSLYKVRSESANNKLNFKVLLELGPETGMPMDSPPKANASAAGKIPQKTTPHGYERPRSYQNHRLSGGQHPNRPANFVEVRLTGNGVSEDIYRIGYALFNYFLPLILFARLLPFTFYFDEGPEVETPVIILYYFGSPLP